MDVLNQENVEVHVVDPSAPPLAGADATESGGVSPGK
jgi:hypothetical protein